MSILIKDNETGTIREYGTNGHDSLNISHDGTCLYYENLQNWGSSLGGGYSFVMEDGKIPIESETADAINSACYFNIGGFRAERERGEWVDVEGWEHLSACNKCGHEIDRRIEEESNFCPECGADMRQD